MIPRLTYTAYTLPFRTPLVTARGTHLERRGFLVAVHTEDGIGIGDVAPWPDAGTETYEEAESFLVSQEAQKPGSQDEAGIPESLPAMRWAVESAAKSKIRNRKSKVQIRVNALLAGGTEGEIVEAAREAVEMGYGTLKVKVGMRPMRSDISILRRLRAEFPAVALRADANGAWSFDEARQFAHGVTACGLEYVEDPLRDVNVEALRVFRRNCEVPLACDDLARTVADKEALLEAGLCDVLILKPAVMGSSEAVERLAAKASAANVPVVITGVLESSVGLAHAAHCAATYGSAELAHGLGTAGLFTRDTLKRPLLARRGELELADLTTLAEQVSEDILSQPNFLR